jgi:hypothetical protein
MRTAADPNQLRCAAKHVFNTDGQWQNEPRESKFIGHPFNGELVERDLSRRTNFAEMEAPNDLTADNESHSLVHDALR